MSPVLTKKILPFKQSSQKMTATQHPAQRPAGLRTSKGNQRPDGHSWPGVAILQRLAARLLDQCRLAKISVPLSSSLPLRQCVFVLPIFPNSGRHGLVEDSKTVPPARCYQRPLVHSPTGHRRRAGGVVEPFHQKSIIPIAMASQNCCLPWRAAYFQPSGPFA
jgi:hypothetical protein